MIFVKYLLFYFVTFAILRRNKKVESYSQSEASGGQTSENALGSAGLWLRAVITGLLPPK